MMLAEALRAVTWAAPRLALAAVVLAAAPPAAATPSSTFWTPASAETQAFAVPHLTYDTYFAESGALQIDTGLTVGILHSRWVQAEAGVDLFHPTLSSRGQLGTLDYLQLNAKVSLHDREDPRSWTLSLGLAGVGFARDVSDYRTLHASFGVPTRKGTFLIGAYFGLGSERLWVPVEREMQGGALLGWVSPDWRIGAAGLEKIVFLVDAAAGKNWMGGIGAAAGLYFTPAIALKTGPVLFADWELYQRLGLPRWVWSVQVDVDVDLLGVHAAAPAPPAPTAAPAPAAPDGPSTR